MQDSQQQCSLCDHLATVWTSFVGADGLVSKAALCATHANTCGWLDAKGWGLLEGWNIVPEKQKAETGVADDLLQSALSAMAQSVSSLSGGHFKSVAVQLHKIGEQGELAPVRHMSAGACPDCGFTVADWKELGRLGCPGCYKTFAASVRRQLPQLHGGHSVHWGKIPDGGQPVLSLARRRRIGLLRERLVTAVGREDYEQASQLRDRIHDLTDNSH